MHVNEESVGSGSASGGGSALIRIEEVEKRYRMGDETIVALNSVSFAINKGSFVAILGASGSGKSTLLNILGCLDTPDSGGYILSDESVVTADEERLATIRNRHIGFIFQTFSLIGRRTALNNVELPLVYRGVKPRMRREMAMQALTKVGLQERARHMPNELSGGQRQRVAIARALVGEPSLLLADEPTGNLDTRTGEEVLALFEELNAEGNTVVMVTHDQGIARRCDHIFNMEDGVLSSGLS